MNHKNMQGEWPKIVLNDLAANCHKIKNNTDVIRGLMKGETVLSLPIHMETLIESANSTELRFVLHCLLPLVESRHTCPDRTPIVKFAPNSKIITD